MGRKRSKNKSLNIRGLADSQNSLLLSYGLEPSNANPLAITNSQESGVQYASNFLFDGQTSTRRSFATPSRSNTAAIIGSAEILKTSEITTIDCPSYTSRLISSPQSKTKRSPDFPGLSNNELILNKWKTNQDVLITEASLQVMDKFNRNDMKNALEVLAMDCEYVGVGEEGQENMLARVSIVNSKGLCIYDKYATPTEEVIDYRTEVSGIRPGNLRNGIHFNQIQQEVRKILANRIVVGHSINNDFKVLCLTHPPKMIRDTAKYKPLREMAGQIKQTPSLKHLAQHLLNEEIQKGEHDSVTDARIAMHIYQLVREKWDKTCKGGARPARK